MSWVTTNATQLSIDQGIGAVTGTSSVIVYPTQTTTYTLTASDDNSQTAQTQIQVTVGPARPNIVMFLVDDMGITDTSVPFAYDASGNPIQTNYNDFYVTPHMETLASQGMKFTQAYATPVCSSTRASLMTGFAVTRHGVTAQINPNGTDPYADGGLSATHRPPNDYKRTGFVENDDITMPMILQDSNYRTIHCGKGHFGSKNSYAQEPKIGRAHV